MTTSNRLASVIAGTALVFFLTSSSYATDVHTPGDPFSGSLLGNPIVERQPTEITITLNSTSPKTITCTTGMLRGSVPGRPANPNFLEIIGYGVISGSVHVNSSTSLSLGGCIYSGGQPMSESGDGTWPITWNVFSGGIPPVAVARIPAGFNFIGQYGEKPCTVIIGPNDAQSMMGRWTNQTQTRPGSITFTNQELIASASIGCSAGAADTADFSATFSADDETPGNLLTVSLK